MRLVLKTDHGSFLLREFLFDQRSDLPGPNGERRLAAIPVGQAPNPFCQDDTVFAKAIGNSDGPAIDFALLGFREDAEGAGPGFFKGLGHRKDGDKTWSVQCRGWSVERGAWSVVRSCRSLLCIG